MSSPVDTDRLPESERDARQVAVLDWRNAEPDEDDRLLAAISAYQRANE